MSASSAWGAIGIYKWKVGPTSPANPTDPAAVSVPNSVSYMLNTAATEVKIEIKTQANPPVTVKTWTTTLEANLSKGYHADVFEWNGNNDGGTPVAQGIYDVYVTATAAPISGTDLVPLWEDTNWGVISHWVAASVNTNPASPYFGYVYAVNWHTTKKGVWMWDPAGNFVTGGNYTGMSWGYSAPWGVDVGTDGYVYVSDHSNRVIWRFSPDLQSHHASSVALPTPAYPKFIAAEGPASNLKMATTWWDSNAQLTTNPLLLTSSSSSWPPGFTAYDKSAEGMLCQPDITSSGNIYVASVNTKGVYTGGSLFAFDMTGNLLSGTGYTLNPNPNIHKGDGLSVSADGNYIWLSRYVDTGSHTDADSSAIYKIDLARAFVDADPYASPAVGVEKFGIACLPTDKRALTLRADAFGNLAATAGNWSFYMSAWITGLYGPPDGGSTNSRLAGRYNWAGDFSPTLISASPSGPLPADGTSGVTVTANVRDLNGYTDIKNCKIDLGQIQPPGGFVPMNRISGSGNDATYTLAFTAPVGTAAGPYTLPLTMEDMHSPAVPAGTGSVIVTVVGGWIEGRVTNSATGEGIEGAKVAASISGVEKYSTLTDSNGDYSLLVTHDTLYSVTASKVTHKENSATPLSVTVGLNVHATGNNFTLDPMDIFHAKYSWIDPNDVNNATWRSTGEVVCVVGTIMRAAAEPTPGTQKGFNNFYYISDRSKASTQQGLRIDVRTVTPADPVYHVGDKIVAEGTIYHFSGTDSPETVVSPSKQPYVVATGQSYPGYSEMQWAAESTWHGRYWHLGAIAVKRVVDASTFIIELPLYSTNLTPYEISVLLDTAATTGLKRPNAGDLIELTAVAGQLYGWGTRYALRPGPGDIKVIQTLTQLGDVKKLADSGVIIDASANPLVVTYVDPGDTGGFGAGRWFWVEQLNKASDPKLGVSGMKVYTGGTAQYLPIVLRYIPPEPPPVTSPLQMGDTITKMTGRLYSTGTDQPGMDRPREFQLIATPSAWGMYGSYMPLPGFLEMTVKSFGGGWLSNKANPGPGDGTPPVIDVLDDPFTPVPPKTEPQDETKMAVGLNTEGVLVKVAGKVLGYGDSGDAKIMWCWIDDGSGTASDLSGATDTPANTMMSGIKCVTLYNATDPWPRSPQPWEPNPIGRPVSVTGLSTNRYKTWVYPIVGGKTWGGRIRMLHMRGNPFGLAPDQLDWLDD